MHANFPAKFHPFVLGHPACLDTSAKDEVATCFHGREFTSRTWAMKGEDVYQVRKAAKIRAYIATHHLEEHLMVPNIYLYWYAELKKVFVVAQKVALSDEVAQPVTGQIKKTGSDVDQRKVLFEGGRTRALSAIQAKALAELSTIGYTYLEYNNLFFTTQGQVAIINTEPDKRKHKKALAKNRLFWWGLLDKDFVKATFVLKGIVALEHYCSDPEAHTKVEQVLQRYVFWTTAKWVGKVALACMALHLGLSGIPLLALGGVASTALKVTWAALLILKISGLVFQIFGLEKLEEWLKDPSSKQCLTQQLFKFLTGN